MQDRDSDKIDRFLTTRWSLIDQAQRDTSADRRAALEELLSTYLPALRTHLVVAKRIDLDRSNDLLQGFVTEKILERNLLAQADPAKGRFRSLLLRSLNNYVVDDVRRLKARKRDGGNLFRLGQEDDEWMTPATNDEPIVFEVAWAKQVLAEVLARMKTQCEKRGTDHTWQVFMYRVVQPLLQGTDPPSYEELMNLLDLATPKQATNALTTAKRQFEEALRFVIGSYVNTEEELEAEIVDLREALLKADSLADSSWQDSPHTEHHGADLDSDLKDADPSFLARMLDSSSNTVGNWSKRDFEAIWRHQMNLPLNVLFSDPNWGRDIETVSQSEDLSVETLADLLTSPSPPIFVLERLKRLAKKNAKNEDDVFPTDIAAALYFGSIAIAMVRCRVRISQSHDEILSNGFRWMLNQGWLDENTVSVVRLAEASLSGDTGSDTSFGTL